ncbi:hypothetical protein KAH37_08200 [bacterium]|nr:hypothetical protein [bacterium]
MPNIFTENPTILMISLALIVALIIGFVIALKIAAFLRSYRARKRTKSGKNAEKNAEKLLKKWGYKIIDTQARRESFIKVDGSRLDYFVTPDIIAEKDGERRVIEVKSGRQAPNPKHGATRRQLIEYSLIFSEFPLYLLDMEQGKLMKIDISNLFRPSPSSKPTNGLSIFTTGLIFGLALSAAAYYFL